MGEVCELAAHGASLGDVEAQRADANGVEEDALPVADADCEHVLRGAFGTGYASAFPSLDSVSVLWTPFFANRCGVTTSSAVPTSA